MGSMPCCGDGGFVRRVAADVEQAAVDLGVEGFDAAVEHLGKAGEVADVAHGKAGVAQGAGGAAGGDEFDAEGGEGLGKVDQAGFVGDAQDGAFNFRHISSLMMKPAEKFREVTAAHAEVSPAVRKNVWQPAPANGWHSGCCRKFMVAIRSAKAARTAED